ncbi:MAG: glucosaminidase domain-containing protein [Candidatus Nanopelagicaceae bacterium]
MIAELAKKAGAKYPELVAAQWACESGWGLHTSGKNNFFGIKGTGTKHKTQEWDGAKFITIVDEFKDYSSPEECVTDLVDKWYKDYKDYKGVNNAPTREAAAKELVKQGYATDPQYAEKLIKLMSQNSAPRSETKTVTNTLVKLADAAKYYKEEAHQKAAWEALEASLTEEQREAFTKAFRGPQKPARAPLPLKPKFPLDVVYFYQRDSKTGHGERSCQSSAVAMAVEYIDPEIIFDDDEYLNIVFKYGDTVSQIAQKKALDSIGIKNQFRMNGSEQDLINILNKGYPVPIGILHKGSIFAPSGGGHWITLIGYDDKSFYVHDPFGELDVINGGYSKTGPADGKDIKYSRTNLMKRWLIASKSDGWFWDLSSNRIK